MKKIAILAVAICGLTAACTVRSERTVVERPAQPTSSVVVSDSAPPPGAVVYTTRP